MFQRTNSLSIVVLILSVFGITILGCHEQVLQNQTAHNRKRPEDKILEFAQRQKRLENDILGKWKTISVERKGMPILSANPTYEFKTNGQIIIHWRGYNVYSIGNKYSFGKNGITLDVEGDISTWSIQIKDNKMTLVSERAVIVLAKLELERAK